MALSGAYVVAHDAEEHAARLLGRTGALKRLLYLGHVLSRLLALDDGLPQFGALALDDEDMEEAASDETAKRVKRQERPDDLKDNGHRHGEAEQKHHYVSPLPGTASAKDL